MRFLLVLLTLLFTFPALSQTAKIQGVVNDDSGKPLSGIYAVATAQSPTDHSTYTSVTNSKGEYSFDKLPPGKYSICIQSPGGTLLNNCQWATTTQATVAAAQTLANQNIAVNQGALLQVRIDDPNKLSTPTDDILVGISLPSGLFHPMRLVAASPTGRTFDTTVPLNTPVRLTIISSRLQLADDKGKDLAPKGGNPNPAPAASSTLTVAGPQIAKGPPVTFTITGRK